MGPSFFMSKHLVPLVVAFLSSQSPIHHSTPFPNFLPLPRFRGGVYGGNPVDTSKPLKAGEAYDATAVVRQADEYCKLAARHAAESS